MKAEYRSDSKLLKTIVTGCKESEYRKKTQKH